MAVNVVWFKRDLRLSDHEPLWRAAADGKPVILLYIFEDMLLADEHYDLRHWRFVWQSLSDMVSRLPNATLWIRQGDALTCLQAIHQCYQVSNIFSHQEVGLLNTFERDRGISRWCKHQNILWYQSQFGAVQRGLSHRKSWDRDWKRFMRADLLCVDIDCLQLLEDPLGFNPFDAWLINDVQFQYGGESHAFALLDDFYQARGRLYQQGISSPSLSRIHCSRLSAYLAWGNISIRQVYQSVLAHWDKRGWRRALIAFSSRLHWHCHFIQKFESEHQMEHVHINAGYDGLPRIGNNEVINRRYFAWQNGETGYPMVDACMKCLLHTGYINFRMRAMLVSFLSHHLALDWRLGVKHLARMFLDFEPGIHYSQFQMQAGVTGINTIRVYNPVKQSKEQDEDTEFICQWLPQLSKLPLALRHEPWTLTPMEQQMFQFELGVDYPEPIVDIRQSGREARDLLWQWRKLPLVRKESARILAKHVRPS